MMPSFRNMRARAWVNGAHSSSRFSRLPETLLWALTLYATGRSIVSFTEVGNDKRVAMLYRLRGWEVVHVNRGDGRDECAIAYRKKRWQLIRHGVFRLSDSPAPFLGHVWSLDALFEHTRTGQTLMWSVVHSPARVEQGDDWRDNPADVTPYKEMMRKWSRNLRNYQNDTDIDHTVATGDLNVNLHRPRWEIMWDNVMKLAGLTSIWAKSMPKAGSHAGKRLIDAAFTDLILLASGVSPFDRSSDHAMIWFRARMRLVKMSTAKWKKVVAERHRRWGIA